MWNLLLPLKLKMLFGSVSNHAGTHEHQVLCASKAEVGHFSPTPRSCAPCWRRGDREKSWSLPAGLDSITLLILLPTSSPRDCVCESVSETDIERGKGYANDSDMLAPRQITHVYGVWSRRSAKLHTQTHTYTLNTTTQTILHGNGPWCNSRNAGHEPNPWYYRDMYDL